MPGTMGLCLEPPQFVTGLARVPNGTGGLDNLSRLPPRAGLVRAGD
jgi:hypothetical protein